MTNVYEGKPDDRQSEDPTLKPSRFRPKYRALTEEEKELHDQIKLKAQEMEALYDKILSGGRYRALAMTTLEESVMWIVKELTA